jgi:hypothetical protein
MLRTTPAARQDPAALTPDVERVWCFSADGWAKVPDPLAAEPGDLDDQLAAAGFSQLFALGGPADTLSLIVYGTEPERDNYALLLSTPATNRLFLADGTPALLALLPSLIGMVKDAAALDRAADEAERSRKRHWQHDEALRQEVLR